MKCEACGAPSVVTRSALTKSGAKTRTYKCQNGHRFHTIERTYNPATRDNRPSTKGATNAEHLPADKEAP